MWNTLRLIELGDMRNFLVDSRYLIVLRGGMLDV